jgi:hypothetical protein
MVIFTKLFCLNIMGIQNKTGKITEAWVKDEILKLGLFADKPVPDRGVDLVVTSSRKPNTILKIQVKGRGEIQKNKRYRWFQVRTTLKQREEAINEGLPVNEAWRKKIAKAEIFILVSQRYHEFWIFKSNDIENLIQVNRLVHGKRKDNMEGHQFEIDLDIKYNDIPLTEIYRKNLNNWDLIINHFL